jgi:hypothetical protein
VGECQSSSNVAVTAKLASVVVVKPVVAVAVAAAAAMQVNSAVAAMVTLRGTRPQQEQPGTNVKCRKAIRCG